MSTIDPIRLQRERALARQGSPAAAAGLVLGALVVLVAGALSGWAMTGLVETSRESQLNSIFADAPPASMTWVWGASVGPILCFAGGGIMTAAAKAYTGVLLTFPVVGPLTIGLVGAAVGTAFGVRAWVPPVTVGVRTDPVFGDDEVWSTFDWVMYHATTWLPLLVAALALVSLVVGIAARRRKAVRRGELDRLVVEGQRVIGDVTAIPTLTEGSALLAPWTVHFIDRSLTDRWVTSHGKFPRDDLPKVGDRVTVLYDPAAPGDKHRIYVGGLEAHTAQDFLRWRL